MKLPIVSGFQYNVSVTLHAMAHVFTPSLTESLMFK